MQTLNLIQGSDEWKAIRLECLTASEAPIMMGVSPHMSRDDLLKYKTTGDEQEISRYQQIIFDKGHAYEAMARPLAEQRCFGGDELFPLTGQLIVDGMRMLASYDGLIMPMQNKSWEHKQFNKELYELVQSGGELEPKHYWQLEHQAIVGELEEVVFTVSDGTDDNKADLIYIPRPERRAELIAHWKQFVADLENYQPQVYMPAPAARVIEQLPALAVQLAGEVKQSNIEIYQDKALSFIRSINTNLQTDEDFADAENTVKFCDRAEKELELVKKQALTQTASIEQLFRTIDTLKEEMRSKRLELDKLVKARKEAIRLEIANAAMTQWSEHLNLINANLKTVKLPAVSIDIAGAIKGKKTIKSLRESANDELARAKVEANQIASIIELNLELMRDIAGAHKFLFADMQQLCTMDKEALAAIAKQRIADHEKAERERIQAEAKRIADAQIEADRKAELAKVQAAAVEAVKPLEASPTHEEQAELFDVPADYEQYAAQSPAFDDAFNQVFGANNVEPLVDMSDFHAGKIAGLEMALRKFSECKANGWDFEDAIHNLINASKLPAKAA